VWHRDAVAVGQLHSSQNLERVGKMYRLSICANTIFLDLPFEKRLKEIAKAGFLVEFWGWKGRSEMNLAACLTGIGPR
jgi:hypothetical protein